MTGKKTGATVALASYEGTDTQLATRTPERSGQTGAPSDTIQSHTLVILIQERTGAVDRVVGLLRRRRANMQALAIGRTEQPNITRITAVTDDSEVGVEQLVAQIRKVVDVQQVSNLTSEQIVARELALIKVQSDAEQSEQIIALGQQFGAQVADIAPDAITLEVSGESSKVEQLVQLLRPFGVREIARTGSVALAR
jgi:acetolactate synthase-1/3 small subunit